MFVYRLDSEIENVMLLGDYNRDWSVDAADYVVWRSYQGQSTAPYSLGDGNGDGLVNNNDYQVWRNAVGTTLATAAPTQFRTLPAAGGALSAAYLGESVLSAFPPSQSVDVESTSSEPVVASIIALPESERHETDELQALAWAAVNATDWDNIRRLSSGSCGSRWEPDGSGDSRHGLLTILALAQPRAASDLGRDLTISDGRESVCRSDVVDGYFSELGNVWGTIQSKARHSTARTMRLI